MPPPRCPHALPLRTLDSAVPTRSPRYLAVSLSSTCTQQRHASAVGPAKGTKTLRLKKKGRPEKTARPPEPGERKALRKRIVLSNTNALSVRDVKPLSMEMESVGGAEVQSLPGEVIDQLRAVEAFKPKQGWSFFQTPAVLVRREVQSLGVEMDAIEGKVEVDGEVAVKKTGRKVVVGEKGAGKSVYLLQAMTMAFQRGWIVINLPEARELTNSHTAFAPIPGTAHPTLYSQPAYTANLLKQTLAANKSVLERLKLSEKPKLPFPVKDNASLAELLALGQNDPERAWPIFQVFWAEITKANANGKEGPDTRPPVMMCLDNMAHVMLKSKYQVLNSAGKLVNVHAHDLALVKYFLAHLSGTSTLPNGGMILAATSASDAPKAEAMDVGIAIAETAQNLALEPANPQKSPYTSAYMRLQALSPTRDADPTALSNFWSPFSPIDTRVLDIFRPSNFSSGVEIVRLTGLSSHEATQLMKYWTRSGMNRGTVLPWTVQEARALSGGAVVGELEQSVVRFLQREGKKVDDEPGGGRIRVH